MDKPSFGTIGLVNVIGYPRTPSGQRQPLLQENVEAP